MAIKSDKDEMEILLMETQPSNGGQREALYEATFDPKYVGYKVALFMLACIAFPPLIFLTPLVHYALKATYQSLRFQLFDDHVEFKEGGYSCFCCCWNAVERIVSLEKVTDVTWSQNWLQRWYGLESISIRTASGTLGGEGGGAADIVLVGTHHSRELRDLILSKKAEREGSARPSTSTAALTSAPAASPMSAETESRLVLLMEKQLEVLTRMEAGQRQ